MTSSPSPYVPEFRGKTLTPVSPRPVHIAEPSNIPVLQNQIDPVFNSTSHHIKAHEDTSISENNSKMESSSEPDTLPTLATIEQSDTLQSGEITGQASDLISQGINDELDMSLDESEGDVPDKPNPASQSVQTSMKTSVTPPASSLPPASNGLVLDTIDLEKPTTPTSIQNLEIATATNSALNEAADASGTIVETTAANGVHVESNGVNFQALLDNLSHPTATAPPADGLVAATTSSEEVSVNEPTSESLKSPTSALPLPANLPPRPPPQEKQGAQTGYPRQDDIRSYHLHTPNPASNGTNFPQQSYRPSQSFAAPIVAAGAPGTASAASGLPPPPLATFQQPAQQQTPAGQAIQSPPMLNVHKQETFERPNSNVANSPQIDEDSKPWGPEIQKLYDQFLEDERAYVAEAQWDKFPPNSRLFIGNLPSEKVTKRDLFDIYHSYGKLAQISIKQAYGFVQFFEDSACRRALELEQGQEVRGRKMHLEISKPQKAGRGAGDGGRKRSRSPDARGRGGRGRNSGRDDRLVDNRSGVRMQDNYRPQRSPSPRGFGMRDSYRGGRDMDRGRDRYDLQRRSRSRSPYGRGSRYRDRSRTPPGRGLDADADLPLPRRHPRDVPEVQFIIVDEVNPNFVAYVAKGFKDRAISTDPLYLNPRLPIAAVIERQVVEGVQAVVRLDRQAELTGKVPLRVFDRRGGVNNVRYDDYENLDVNIAAEIVFRAKQTHAAPPSYGPPPQVNYGPQYAQPFSPQGPPQGPPQAAPQIGTHVGANPDLSSLIASLDGQGLQKLLGALQPPASQTQAQPYQQGQGAQPDLNRLLAGSHPQQQQLTQQLNHYQQQQQQQPHAQPHAYGQLGGNPALASLLANTGHAPPQHQNPVQQQQPSGQVANIMEQLAKWRQTG